MHKKLFNLAIVLLLAICPLSAHVSLTEFSAADHVNLFLGTAGDNGQVAPGATVPFGMVQVCPDSDPRQHPGYDFEVPHISGISVNRLSGVGGSGCGGNVSLLPVTSSTNVSIVKGSEQAVPGFYSTELDNGVQVELTATAFMAIERYTFPTDAEAALILNPRSTFAKYYDHTCKVTAQNTMEGTVTCANTCNRGRYTLYWRLFANRPFTAEAQEGDRFRLSFGKSGTPIELRILLSANGTDGLDRRTATVWETTFEQCRDDAATQWNQLLGRIRVCGLNNDEQTIFYSSLYRALHSPFRVTDSHDRSYTATNGSTLTADGFDYYSSWSLWDTYRTKFPLLTLVAPQQTRDIMTSLAQLYITGKKDWSTDHECVPTVRTEHAIATLLDAYRKGIDIPNLPQTWDGMVAEVKAWSLKAPDQVMEAVADWWALAEMGEELGRPDEADAARQRGIALFDSIWPTAFMNIDDSYVNMKNNGLYQGTRWQYRWAVPQYLDRMIALHGKDQLLSELTEFFDRNLYNQGNEPDIHVPFLFGRLGDASRTAPVVHDMLLREVKHIYGGNAEYPEPYVGRAFMNAPRGYAPEMDEDDGTMSAWLVFASMGLYPLIVGEPTYELFSPTFDTIILEKGNGKYLTISTRGRTSLDDPIRKIRIDGRRLRTTTITHDQLMRASHLTFIY